MGSVFQVGSVDTNGFIGIQPISEKEDTNGLSFINNLVKDGLIDHKIVSIYTHMERGNHSIIKFGSWDSNALKKNTSLNLHKTESPKIWSLTGASMMFRTYVGTLKRRINLSPEYPYIYLPDNDWKRIQSILGTDVCNYDNNFCKLKGPCSSQDKSSFDFSF